MGQAQQPSPNAAPVPPLDWPPVPDAANTVVQAVDGRKIERYVHGLRASWNYPAPFSTMFTFRPGKETGKDQEQINSFYVVSPKTPRENAPLMVVLHSANRTAYDYLGYACLDRAAGPGEIPKAGGTNPPTDFYAVFLNTMNDEWYGWSQARENSAKNITGPTSAELRLFDTIEWVVTHYKIDRNRIYLTGMSMGGCGGLALGMPHGDIFAALRVFAPAGTEYASLRMGGFAPAPAPDAPPAEHDAWLKRASGVGLPDPPYMVDSSSQTDDWSKTQPALLQAAKAGHLPLGAHVGALRTFRLALRHRQISGVRSGARFPVDGNPQDRGLSRLHQCLVRPSGAVAHSSTGKIRRERPDECLFPLEKRKGHFVRLLHANSGSAHPEIKNPPPTMHRTRRRPILPSASPARIQDQPGHRYTWQLSRDGHAIASGQATPDLANLLTIPKLPLTTKPSELSIK